MKNLILIFAHGEVIERERKLLDKVKLITFSSNCLLRAYPEQIWETVFTSKNKQELLKNLSGWEITSGSLKYDVTYQDYRLSFDDDRIRLGIFRQVSPVEPVIYEMISRHGMMSDMLVAEYFESVPTQDITRLSDAIKILRRKYGESITIVVSACRSFPQIPISIQSTTSVDMQLLYEKYKIKLNDTPEKSSIASYTSYTWFVVRNGIVWLRIKSIIIDNVLLLVPLSKIPNSSTNNAILSTLCDEIAQQTSSFTLRDAYTLVWVSKDITPTKFSMVNNEPIRKLINETLSKSTLFSIKKVQGLQFIHYPHSTINTIEIPKVATDLSVCIESDCMVVVKSPDGRYLMYTSLYNDDITPNQEGYSVMIPRRKYSLESLFQNITL